MPELAGQTNQLWHCCAKEVSCFNISKNGLPVILKKFEGLAYNQTSKFSHSLCKLPGLVVQVWQIESPLDFRCFHIPAKFKKNINVLLYVVCVSYTLSITIMYFAHGVLLENKHIPPSRKGFFSLRPPLLTWKFQLSLIQYFHFNFLGP